MGIMCCKVQYICKYITNEENVGFYDRKCRSCLTLSNTKLGPTVSQNVVRHFMACPRVLISDTLLETPENNNLLKLKSIPV